MKPRAERNQKMTNIFEKLEKIVKISIKLRVFTISCSSVGTGGGGVMFTGGLMEREGRGVGNSKRLGAKTRWDQ